MLLQIFPVREFAKQRPRKSLPHVKIRMFLIVNLKYEKFPEYKRKNF